MFKKLMVIGLLVTLSVLMLPEGVEAQRNMNVNRADQRMAGGMGGQFMMRGPTTPEEMLAFLQTQKLTEDAQKLEGLMKNPARQPQLQQEMGRLNQVYGMVIRQMEFDPEGAQRSLERIKLEGEIRKTAAEAQGKSGSALTPIRKKLMDQTGQLFDMILTEEEARLKQLEEFIRTGDISALGGMGAMMGMGRGQGRGQQQGAGRGGGRGQQQGMGRGGGMGFQMNPEIMQEQLKEGKANFEKWKKNKNMIVNIRVQELLLGIRPFPWMRGGMGMMRMFE